MNHDSLPAVAIRPLLKLSVQLIRTYRGINEVPSPPWHLQTLIDLSPRRAHALPLPPFTGLPANPIRRIASLNLPIYGCAGVPPDQEAAPHRTYNW